MAFKLALVLFKRPISKVNIGATYVIFLKEELRHAPDLFFVMSVVDIDSLSMSGYYDNVIERFMSVNGT